MNFFNFRKIDEIVDFAIFLCEIIRQGGAYRIEADSFNFKVFLEDGSHHIIFWKNSMMKELAIFVSELKNQGVIFDIYNAQDRIEIHMTGGF